MTAETVQLYDLAAAQSERRFSPYCWRVRLALAHKGLAVETIPWRLTDKQAIAPSGQERVPVLVDRGRWIADSWEIAKYLEAAYPQAPSLFGGDAGQALSLLHSKYADTLNAAIFRFVALDIWRHLHEQDREYFRSTRERRVGMALETLVGDRDQRLEAFRDSLAPLRLSLKAQPFLGGEQPLYADYAVFGAFQWARCISPYALLAADDPVARWRERLLDAFDGLARAAPGYEA